VFKSGIQSRYTEITTNNLASPARHFSRQGNWIWIDVILFITSKITTKNVSVLMGLKTKNVTFEASRLYLYQVPVLYRSTGTLYHTVRSVQVKTTDKVRDNPLAVQGRSQQQGFFFQFFVRGGNRVAPMTLHPRCVFALTQN
jgi:hypothetical protein